MKKKLFVLALSAFLLSGCQMIKFIPDEKEEGFEDDSQKPETRVIEYFDGDQLETLGHTSHIVTFKANEENAQPVLTDEAAVKNVMEDADSFVTGVTNISNVSQFHGLKIGHLNNLIDGSITFTLSANLTGVEIYARPRSSVVASGEAITPVIDNKVALNVNGSKYIKVKCDYTTVEDIKDTKLSYKISGDILNEITINAVHERAEITKIVFYE